MSFGGVVLIAFSNSSSAKTATTQIDGENGEGFASGMQTLGCCLIFLTSWCVAVVAILTRQMQKMNFAVVLFYYSVVSMVISLGIVLV